MFKVKSNINHNNQEFKAGDIFEGSESEIKRLVSLGALEEVVEGKEKDETPKADAGKPNKRSNRASLMEYCRANGIEVSEEANKEELLQAIEAFEANKPAENPEE